MNNYKTKYFPIRIGYNVALGWYENKEYNSSSVKPQAELPLKYRMNNNDYSTD